MRSTRLGNYRTPMSVHVAKGSPAEKAFRGRAGLPGSGTVTPEAIAGGLPPTKSHDLHFHGGKTIGDLVFVNLFVGGAQSASPSGWANSDVTAINNALAAAMSDTNLNNVMVQYFVQNITSRFDSSEILPGTPPALVSQGDIEKLIQTLAASGRFQKFDLANTLFNFLLPPGTVLNTDNTPTATIATTPATAAEKATTTRTKGVVIPEDEADSLHGLGGYHGSVHVNATDTVYYAVGVYSQQQANGATNGIPVFDAPWKNVVATFYHELNEARTDADVEDAIRAGNDPTAVKFLGWTSKQGEECGDFPVFEANPLTKVFQEVRLTSNPGTAPVQFQYSNAVHGPEAPIAHPEHRAKRTGA